MKPCADRWREELADYILGAPASGALAAHLEECAACSAALREWKARIGQIDAGIRQLAASEPSARAASRVLAEVRSRRRWRWVPEWNRVAAALVGLTIFAASMTYVWRARERREETDRALSAAAAIGSWRSPTRVLLRSPTDRLLKAPPRLGEYFYPLKSDTLKKEKEDP
jgi:anti-sigma factor RsiW